MRKIITAQFIILLIGTLFAWSNFGYELYLWLNEKACQTGCVAYTANPNPFLTPCFYGALFFLIAFILSAIMFKKSRQSKIAE